MCPKLEREGIKSIKFWKRAREISEAAEENKEIMTEKPVSIALEEILDGKFTIVEPEEIRNI